MDPTTLNLDRVAGCLLGGALGDALGGPVEFRTLAEIRGRFGADGVAGFDDFRRAGVAGSGQITDDTQMTLFTAEGLLRAECRSNQRGVCDPISVVHHAYLRWLHTQGEHSQHPGFENGDDGWLIAVPQLHARRAPGNTCVGALRSGQMGTVSEPINHSKGCGGVMRAAPAGIFPVGADPFTMGTQVAAITHGHPGGYLPAGCLAQMIHDLLEGASLPDAVQNSMRRLEREREQEESLNALRAAVALWEADEGRGATPERVEQLGGGWVGEEALAIAVYCALEAGNDFARGIRLAVNHSGDSDSTGSIAGNLLGALLGAGALPGDWLDALELKDVIAQISSDLVTGFQDTPAWWERYPGW
jgi:ADP-ribosylglycohydrolase